MKKNILSRLLFLSIGIMTIIGFSSCNKSKYDGYKETDNGLFYNIVVDQETEKCSVGDYLKIDIQYRTMNDSILFDSKIEKFPVWIKIDETSYRGDIMEGISMLSIGDSASFVVRVDSFYLRTIHSDAYPQLADSMMYVNIKVLDGKTNEQFEIERHLIEQETKIQMEELRIKELDDLDNYLKLNKITQKPTASGLIFIPIKNGNGIPILNDQKVICQYTGRFIDGQIFDSSNGLEPLQVKIGGGDVINGFDEGLRFMSKGAKAKFIIPSSIGFGESNINSSIPPYTTLIFEVEVLDVIK